IVAIVGNAAEHGGAVVIAHRGDMKLASEIAVSSSAQVAVFVAPAIALLSWLVGEGLALSFRPIEIATMGLSALGVAYVVRPALRRPRLQRPRAERDRQVVPVGPRPGGGERRARAPGGAVGVDAREEARRRAAVPAPDPAVAVEEHQREAPALVPAVRVTHHL